MKHDESIDVKRLRNVGVRTAIEPTATGTVKCLIIPKDLKTKLGIKSWGRIDFLVHYCKYRIITSVNSTATIVSNANNNDTEKKKVNYRELKKAKKETKLTDKNKKKGK